MDTLYKATTRKVGENVTEKATDRITKNQSLILKLISERPNITTNKLASTVGISERINPGDKVYTLTTIKKVTSGSTPETGQLVDALYREIVTAGTLLASSIKVAEAVKIIENLQHDINIAFVNELSKIFHRMGIDTLEVLEASGTKWNFLPFRPGLVGGHCIGVESY